jgi:hypothetical protein
LGTKTALQGADATRVRIVLVATNVARAKVKNFATGCLQSRLGMRLLAVDS